MVGCRCTGAKSCDLNERRNQEAEEIHGSKRLPMRVDTWARLRGWFTLPRAWRLSADKPKSRYPSDYYEPSNLHQRNERAHPSVLFLSLSLFLFPRLLSFFQLPKVEISVDLDSVWIALVLSEIRERFENVMFSLGLRTMAIKQRGGLNGCALLLYVHPCVRYVSTLPLGIFVYFMIYGGGLVFVQRG